MAEAFGKPARRLGAGLCLRCRVDASLHSARSRSPHPNTSSHLMKPPHVLPALCRLVTRVAQACLMCLRVCGTQNWQHWLTHSSVAGSPHSLDRMRCGFVVLTCCTHSNLLCMHVRILAAAAPLAVTCLPARCLSGPPHQQYPRNCAPFSASLPLYFYFPCMHPASACKRLKLYVAHTKPPTGCWRGVSCSGPGAGSGPWSGCVTRQWRQRHVSSGSRHHTVSCVGGGWFVWGLDGLAGLWRWT